MFGLVDCNNFFVSCERVFAPQLQNKPVVVLSNNDGCVVARSNEVKAMGVKMGVPFFECQKIFEQHKVVVFSANFTLYADMSNRVMETIFQCVPEMEQYSIDEAFLNFQGYPKEKLLEIGRIIRHKVLKRTGIPVSVGIGPTRTLAKAANEVAKKQKQYAGVLEIGSNNRDEILDQLPIGDIWGIGRGYQKRLELLGVYNASQLIQLADNLVLKKLSISGLRTVRELRGENSVGVDDLPRSRKSILCSRSFKNPILQKGELWKALASFVSNAVEDLREEELSATAITVFIRTNRFNENYYSNVGTIEFLNSSNYTPQFLEQAEKILSQIFRPGLQYKRAGVMLTGITPTQKQQLDIFSSEEENKKRAGLMRAVDLINRKQGKAGIRFASEGNHLRSSMSKKHKSQEYTTNWNELLKVRI